MKLNLLISESAVVIDRAQKASLRRNPPAFAQKLGLRDLVSVLKAAHAAYYTDGTSDLTDAQYDALERELRDRRPGHPFIQMVDSKAPVKKNVRTKVILPYALFSLDKMKPGEASFPRWVSTHKGPYVISDKEDGSSLEVVYDGGRAVAAYTKGKNGIGQDVTRLLPKFKIPLTIPYKKRFAVRNEIVMSESVFNSKFSKELSDTSGKKYENSRNLVAGAINTLKREHEALDHIHVISYEILEPRMVPSEALKLLKTYGFKVVPHTVVPTVTEDSLLCMLKTRKAKSPVEIDGLVVEQNKKTVRPSIGNPDYAIAFKAELEGDTALVKVLKVTWTESQYGTLNPVIWIEPTRLAGATVKKASAFNAKFIETGFRQKDKTADGKKAVDIPKSQWRPIGPGSILRVKRSGNVIPHVIEVVKPARRPSMPTVPYEYTDTGVDIRLVTKTNLVRDKRMTTFFTVLGIEGIKESTVAKLADAGLDTVIKIIKAKPSAFLAIDGFKTVSANKLWASIHDKVDKPIPLETLMKASGNFDMGMGERRLKVILKAVPDVVDLYEKKGARAVMQRVLAIHGFKDKTASVFVSGLPDFIKWFRRSGLKIGQPVKIKTVSASLKGQVVVFTGFRDKELSARIEKASGAVSPSFTRDCTILVVPSASYHSTKVDKAAKTGATVMPVEQFVKKYKV